MMDKQTNDKYTHDSNSSSNSLSKKIKRLGSLENRVINQNGDKGWMCLFTSLFILSLSSKCK